MRLRIIGGLLAAAFAGSAAGHHSNAALDLENVVSVEGTITEYTLRNPHSYFVVEATDDAGATVSWEVQMGSAISMRTRGWTPQTLSLGDQVVVGLHAARDGRPYGLFSSLERDGQTISYDRLPQPEPEIRATSLDGIWLTDRELLPADDPGGLAELMDRELTLTDKGRAARDAFSQDSMENPELSCITKPTPGGILYTVTYPMQIEILEEQQIIMIRIQYFDQERTVYMDGRAHPPADQRTHEGHSIGWWEDDVLVVETTNFADDRSPYQNGVPSGAQKHVVERYWLHDNGIHMTAQFTLEDPEYIVGSMSHERVMRYSPHRQMTPFDCDLETTRRYLPNR